MRLLNPDLPGTKRFHLCASFQSNIKYIPAVFPLTLFRIFSILPPRRHQRHRSPEKLGVRPEKEGVRSRKGLVNAAEFTYISTLQSPSYSAQRIHHSDYNCEFEFVDGHGNNQKKKTSDDSCSLTPSNKNSFGLLQLLGLSVGSR